MFEYEKFDRSNLYGYLYDDVFKMLMDHMESEFERFLKENHRPISNYIED